MAKGTRGRRRIASRQRRLIPYQLPSGDNTKDMLRINCPKVVEKKDWEDSTCPVCMEYPHNAVLLLCSSHNKGCRPYMCGTSDRYSNCLDRYKKAYTKVTSSLDSLSRHDLVNSPAIGCPLSSWPAEKCGIAQLACPLCRGQVKGWTVVELAREYLNSRKRSCMQETCSFVGNYKQLHKHVRTEHPFARPHEVDPLLEQKWRRLEHDLETEDVISTIRSSMPGTVVSGDYVIEGSRYGLDSDEEYESDEDDMERSEGSGVRVDRMENNVMNVFLLLQAFHSARNVSLNRSRRRNRRHPNRSFRWN